MNTTSNTLTAIPASAVARIVRKELKKAFPDVKFSVSGTRSDWYLAQGELTIRWTDGPEQNKVEAVVKKYRGVKMLFDPYADYWESEYIANEDGTYYAVGSINISRNFSEEVRIATNAKLMELSGAASQQDLEDNFHTFDRAAILKALVNPDIDAYIPELNNYDDALRFALNHDDHPIALTAAA